MFVLININFFGLKSLFIENLTGAPLKPIKGTFPFKA